MRRLGLPVRVRVQFHNLNEALFHGSPIGRRSRKLRIPLTESVIEVFTDGFEKHAKCHKLPDDTG